MAEVECSGCGIVLDEKPDITLEQRNPCPSCGSTTRIHNVSITETVKAWDGLGLKAKHGGTGKPYAESINVPNVQRKTGKMMILKRIIDRENDIYHEIVTDPDTGNIVHECKEPLSKHIDHGTVKFKK